MYISETRVYGERGSFFHLSAFRGAKGDVKALGIGASNGLETRLYIQQFMISTQGKECTGEERGGSTGRNLGR